MWCVMSLPVLLEEHLFMFSDYFCSNLHLKVVLHEQQRFTDQVRNGQKGGAGVDCKVAIRLKQLKQSPMYELSAGRDKRNELLSQLICWVWESLTLSCVNCSE